MLIDLTDHTQNTPDEKDNKLDGQTQGNSKPKNNQSRRSSSQSSAKIEIREEAEEHVSDLKIQELQDNSKFLQLKNPELSHTESNSNKFKTLHPNEKPSQSNFNSSILNNGVEHREDIAFSFAKSSQKKVTEKFKLNSTSNIKCDSRIMDISQRSTQRIKVEFKSKTQQFDPIILDKIENGSVVFGFKPSSIELKTSLIDNQQIDYFVPFELNQLTSKATLFKIIFLGDKVSLCSLISNPDVLFQAKINQTKGWPIVGEGKFLMGDMLFKLQVDSSNNKLSLSRMITKRYNDKINIMIETTDSPFTIGRHKSCNLPFDSVLLSRVHASLLFNSNSGFWTLQDGEPERPSANGCFVFSDKQIEIEDTLEFKLNTNIVIISLIEH